MTEGEIDWRSAGVVMKRVAVIVQPAPRRTPLLATANAVQDRSLILLDLFLAPPTVGAGLLRRTAGKRAPACLGCDAEIALRVDRLASSRTFAGHPHPCLRPHVTRNLGGPNFRATQPYMHIPVGLGQCHVESAAGCLRELPRMGQRPWLRESLDRGRTNSRTDLHSASGTAKP